MKLVAARLRTVAAQLPYVPRALRLVWEASHTWTLVWFALLLLQGLLPVATVYLTRSVVNAVAAAIGHGASWPILQPIVTLVGVLAAVALLSSLSSSAADSIRTLQAERVKDHISSLIQEKASTLDLAYFESPDYYDRLHRARVDAQARPVTLLENLGGVLQNGITLIAMAGVLIPYGIWLPIALLLSTTPALWVVLRFALRQHEWRQRTTAAERVSWYYDWLLTARETAAEMRLFGLAHHFQELFKTLRRRLRDERWQLAKDQSVGEFAAGTISLVAMGGAFVVMLWRASAGEVTLGDLALLYQAFNQGQSLMRSLLENTGQIFSSSLFLSNLFEYLGLEPQVVNSEITTPAPSVLRTGIEFRDVSFRYPGSDRRALNKFELSVPAGQTIAVVGPNGAGKSSVIKLLCRFYDPEAGTITLDGIDIKSIPLEELRRQITVLFQEPVHYNAKARENVAYGDLESQPDLARVKPAAEAAGADEIIERLPDDYETLLGRWLAGGTELSVGEWQRVALARAFVRRAPIIVLDEPTSAMDSWAEADWLERFGALAQGRTCIIVTHRFTTAMRADFICVMEEGEVVESGDHRALLAMGGRYARSWQAQMREHPRSLLNNQDVPKQPDYSPTR